MPIFVIYNEDGDIMAKARYPAKKSAPKLSKQDADKGYKSIIFADGHKIMSTPNALSKMNNSRDDTEDKPPTDWQKANAKWDLFAVSEAMDDPVKLEELKADLAKKSVVKEIAKVKEVIKKNVKK